MTPEETQPTPVQLPNSVAKRGRLTLNRDAKIWYSSNPFMAAIQGMVIGLLENAVAILVIPIVAIATVAITSIIPILLSSFMSSILTSIVFAIWLGLQVLILLFALSLHLQLMIASFHQERISVHIAIDRALQRPLGFFGVVTVCFALPFAALILIFQSESVTQILLGGALLIPSYFIIARLWLAAYFFYEQGDDLRISLINSWQLTAGRTFEMFGVIAAQFPLCVVGILSPLIASSGFTTRYFQLRYVKSHGFVQNIKINWVNYLLTFGLLLSTGYVVLRQVTSARDSSVRVCYIQDSTTTVGTAQQICQTRKDCNRDPICHSREVNKDPTFTIVP